MFFITAGYHRYFAHRSYKMGRVAGFVMALGGGTAAQKGPLWWAGNHRRHHQFAHPAGTNVRCRTEPLGHHGVRPATVCVEIATPHGDFCSERGTPH